MSQTAQKTWHAVRQRRTEAHRERCVAAANQAIADLKAIGVDAVVFGSLVDRAGPFRPDSDIDICILDDAGILFSELENIVRLATRPASIDLFAFAVLKPEIRHNILTTGVRYVE